MSFGNQADATGENSIVFGYYANSNGKRGSFVYADASSGVATMSTADNQFMVRASGGTILYSNSAMTAGISLPAGGGSWSSISDKNKKEHFKKEDPAAILSKLDQLEISSWNYKTQPSSIRHIGPMAQDFYRAFHFGESDTTITTIDADGISLLAIQALSAKTAELKRRSDEVEQLKAQVDKLQKEKILLEKRITDIEKKVVMYAPSASISKGDQE
jgi:hypothetical protein